MRWAFSVTFEVVAMLGLLLAGLAIYGQARDWEIPVAWSVVLGCVWLAILGRVCATVAGVVTEVRTGVPEGERGEGDGSYAGESAAPTVR